MRRFTKIGLLLIGMLFSGLLWGALPARIFSQSTFVSANAVLDGDATSFAILPFPDEFNQFMIIDLGMGSSLKKVLVTVAKSNRLKGVEVLMSNDIVNWKKVSHKISRKGSLYKIKLKKENRGRYVRINFGKDLKFKPLNVVEIEFVHHEIVKQKIYDVVIASDASGATISYKTKLPSVTYLLYGTNFDYLNNGNIDKVYSDISLKNKHMVFVPGLEEGTTYVLRIGGHDENHKRILGHFRYFSTKQAKSDRQVTWPQVEAAEVAVVGDTEAYFKLRAKQDVSGVFELEDKESLVVTKIASIQNGKLHSLWIHELKPAHKYSFSFKMINAQGNIDDSDKLTFETKNTNFAFRKAVDGTFVNRQPDDKHVSTTNLYPITQINDGGDSYFTSMSTSGDPDKEEQFVIIDLGKDIPISEVLITWRSLAYSKEYNISISSDSSQWRELAIQQDAGDGLFGYSITGDPVRIMSHVVKGVSGRYLKISLPKGSSYHVVDPAWKFVQIMEVKVF